MSLSGPLCSLGPFGPAGNVLGAMGHSRLCVSSQKLGAGKAASPLGKCQSPRHGLPLQECSAAQTTFCGIHVSVQTLRAYWVPVVVTKRFCGQMNKRRKSPSAQNSSYAHTQKEGRFLSGGSTIWTLSLQIPLCTLDPLSRTQLSHLQSLP